MNLHLDDRHALVTGASAGIGRAVALSLAAEGVRLMIVARRGDLLGDVVEESRNAGARSVDCIELDLAQPQAVERLEDTLRERGFDVDILMNCMGGSRTIGLDASEDDWDESMTLNWTRHRQLTHRLIPSMRSRQWGRVINVTGPNEASGLNSAAVAKAALHAWAKGVSDLVAADGVTVNCIGPGKIDSEQMRRLYTPERRASFAESQIPMRRFGRPEELADLATFLASPRAGYITGTVMHVDGGFRRYMY